MEEVDEDEEEEESDEAEEDKDDEDEDEDDGVAKGEDGATALPEATNKDADE